MQIESPKIDERKLSDILRSLKTIVPHYTPEWEFIEKMDQNPEPHIVSEMTGSNSGDPGIALIKIFSHMTEIVIDHLNQVPRKNFIAFLDMLGIKLLPAQPARAPLTFKLSKGLDSGVLIPPRSQAAAGDIPFETEKALMALPNELNKVISFNPYRDVILVTPPGFIEGKLEEITLHNYETFGSATAGNKTLQIDHVTDLEEGDFLKICNENDLKNFDVKNLSEYIIISSISGNSVSFVDGLTHSYPANTPVEKVTKFSLIEGKNMQEHILYMGHNDLFNIEDAGVITLEIVMASEAASTSLNLVWEYWGEDKENEIVSWLPLHVQDDKTIGLSKNGKIVLLKNLKGEIKEEELGKIFQSTSRPEIKDETINEIKSRWIRCSLKDPLTTNSFIKLPTIDTISVKSKTSDSIAPDAGFFNDVPLDLEKDEGLYPFGKKPRIYDTFYIGSQEGFSKKEAKIKLQFDLTFDGDVADLIPKPNPQLSWEYWNGNGWQSLIKIDGKDDIVNLYLENEITDPEIEFECPHDMEETEVSGQKNYWIRSRIVGGDYGRDEFSIGYPSSRAVDSAYVTQYKHIITPKFNPPKLSNLTISYEFHSTKKIQFCFSYNNLDFQNRTDESINQKLYFQPFVRMDEINLSLYLGFDKPLMGGPIRIFFDTRELSYTENKKPKLEWTYSVKDYWEELDYHDVTEGLIRREILEFLIGSSAFSGQSRFGEFGYWIKGSLTAGEYEEIPVINGIYPNSTWAFQAETIRKEILGSSTGELNQPFFFFKFPVIKGQEIRVRELLSAEEKQNMIILFGKDAIHEEKDETGKVTETWVLWREVPDFFDSEWNDRHYILDRATGQIEFGDGNSGMTPPKGEDNIQAFSYQAGGGVKGNVIEGSIDTFKSAVDSVDSILNPVAADGGSDTATTDQMLEIGPAKISHRDRAVTFEDFEWLAKEASRKVVKARCLPNTNNNMVMESGWVTVIIVPDSHEDKPKPTLELRKFVRQYIGTRCANTISSPMHVHVDGPSYMDISVDVNLFITSMDTASLVEREAREKLNAFFHPLTGGAEGKGWEFGRDVSVSDIYVLLEDIEDLDHVENLKLTYDGTVDGDVVEIGENYLVANGSHNVTLKLIN